MRLHFILSDVLANFAKFTRQGTFTLWSFLCEPG